jgi:hypothetical protein
MPYKVNVEFCTRSPATLKETAVTGMLLLHRPAASVQNPTVPLFSITHSDITDLGNELV